MKTRLFEIIICLLICSCSHGPAEFHVITTTDLHGALDSTMSSIYSYITNARAEYGDNLIVLDCGDNVQGSPQAYYSDYVDYADSSIFAKVFNELQYDALKGPCSWTSMLHRAFRNMAENMGYVNEKSVTATIVSASQQDAVLNKGPLTPKDIISIYPYENTMSIIEMTGREIKDYLEYAYSLLLDYPDNPIYVFDTVSGLEYTVDTRKPYGSRITMVVESTGHIYSPSTSYRVAMSTFRASGGNGHLTRGLGWSEDKMKARTIAVSKQSILSMLMNLFSENPVDITAVNDWSYL